MHLNQVICKNTFGAEVTVKDVIIALLFSSACVLLTANMVTLEGGQNLFQDWVYIGTGIPLLTIVFVVFKGSNEKRRRTKVTRKL